MTIALPLEQMSLAEKLATMELLWADLSKNPTELPSPTWHREVLRDRRQGVADGTLKFLDWDAAMTQLRGELRGNPAT